VFDVLPQIPNRLPAQVLIVEPWPVRPPVLQ
jgi:hypothetical protein